MAAQGLIDLYKEIGERANSRLGESVSDLYRAKIRLVEFKAVYSIYKVKVTGHT